MAGSAGRVAIVHSGRAEPGILSSRASDIGVNADRSAEIHGIAAIASKPAPAPADRSGACRSARSRRMAKIEQRSDPTFLRRYGSRKAGTAGNARQGGGRSRNRERIARVLWKEGVLPHESWNECLDFTIHTRIGEGFTEFVNANHRKFHYLSVQPRPANHRPTFPENYPQLLESS